MKKPFITLKSKSDLLKLIVCVLLCASVVSMFFIPSEGITVFFDNGSAPKSLFGLLQRII